ncbi:MAG: MoxR family ATPase [Acidobacteriota bacterium]|jgi:MoxR-like ATPase|nr:MoxR family ATPase [Acidobacteriota bacterium]
MDVAALGRAVIDNVEKVVVGKRDAVRLSLVCLLCEGHVLLEDVPGVAKTMLARALALSVGCTFARVQCTPDLLPSDVTGVSVFNQKALEFEFRRGPVFHQILLADEINRATPRAQSSLLECMAERQVSVDGQTYALARPFMVLATQNPIEHEGTFPLPEAQLDRFLMRMSIGYPSFSDENEMLERLRLAHPIDQLGQVISSEQLIAAQAAVREVFVHEKVREYIVRLVHATRRTTDLAMGASPRASIALYRTAQALAALDGRNYAAPDDVKYVVKSVLSHRVIVAPEARLRGHGSGEIIDALVERVPAPVEKGRG